MKRTINDEKLNGKIHESLKQKKILLTKINDTISSFELNRNTDKKHLNK